MGFIDSIKHAFGVDDLEYITTPFDITSESRALAGGDLTNYGALDIIDQARKILFSARKRMSGVTFPQEAQAGGYRDADNASVALDADQGIAESGNGSDIYPASESLRADALQARIVFNLAFEADSTVDKNNSQFIGDVEDNVIAATKVAGVGVVVVALVAGVAALYVFRKELGL